MSTSPQRFPAIDQLKGLAIVCITLLHFEAGLIPSGLNIWIGSFMISAFYFTSGWLMGIKGTDKLPTIRELIFKRWRSLGVPYLWFSALILVFDILWISLGFDEWRLLGRDFYKTLTLRGIGTLWFLPALFFGELFFVWIIRRKLYWQIIALLLTLVWYWAYGRWFTEYAFRNDIFRIIDAPFRSIQNAMGAWPVIFFAYYICRLVSHKLQQLNIHITALTGIILSVVSYWSSNYLFGFLPSECSVLWGWVAPVFGPLALLLIFTATQHIRLNSFFSFWGKNSLVLMATHYSIYQVMCEAFCERVLGITEFVGWITIACFSVTMLIEYPTTYLINHYTPFLLGKRKQRHA